MRVFFISPKDFFFAEEKEARTGEEPRKEGKRKNTSILFDRAIEEKGGGGRIGMEKNIFYEIVGEKRETVFRSSIHFGKN